MQPQMKTKIEAKLAEGRQYRRNDASPEFRVAEQSEDSKELIVEGHACTFNDPYELYRYDDFDGYTVIVREQIDAHAFDECDMSDVIMQYDHEGRVFARSRNKTLEARPDDIGLFSRANLTRSAGGPALYADIKGGFVDRMSIGFTVAEDRIEQIEDSETKTIDILRTITKIGKLYDVSAVSIPANDGTDISARNFGDGVISEIKAERLKEQKKERKKKQLELELLIAKEKKL